ncbi:hypothetical protein [Treponema denticola]|uniref:hypothetical protein n=1 Tax=Treponema denticola TaxID=158 RepID=UPI00208DA8BD|nr:hypothetical protein [Treponema denticola]
MLRLNIVSEREMLMVEGVQVIMGRKKVKILYTLQFPMEAVNIHRLPPKPGSGKKDPESPSP